MKDCVICGIKKEKNTQTCSQDCLNKLRSQNTSKSNKKLGLKPPRTKWSGAMYPHHVNPFMRKTV